jgi:FKBP-type peptidyl-prolyl cis-trans isomerase FklB
MVEVNYRGTLIDGTEFDSSYKRGQPASFQLARIIPGWKEALKLMPTGSKWQIFIPPALAYGTRGSGDKIGPNATLIFEVELLSVKEAPAQPEKKPVATPPVPAPAPKN